MNPENKKEGNRGLTSAQVDLIMLEKNTCLCDCLPCKTDSCLHCNCGDTRPDIGNFGMCFSGDSAILDHLTTIYAERAGVEAKVQGLVDALEIIANHSTKLDCIPELFIHSYESGVAIKAIGRWRTKS